MNQVTRYNRLAKDLEMGRGDSYTIPYLMLQYGSKALIPLVRGLKCPTFGMRANCVECLQKLGDPKAVDALIQMFDDFDNDPISFEITEAIEQLCRWNNLNPIFNALHSGTSRIKIEIAQLLIDYVDYNAEPVLPELIKALKDTDTGVFVYITKTIEAWATYHNDRNSASTALVAFLADNDPARRLFAASALGHSGNLDAAYAIINAIYSYPNDKQFHDFAAISLVEISEKYDDNVLNQRIDNLLNSTYFKSKEYFLSLKNLEEEEIEVDAVFEVTQPEESPDVLRENAPDAPEPELESFNDLIGQLKDPDPKLNIFAIQKLGKLANFEATMDLCLQLSNSNHEVQLEAIKALRKIGDKRATAAFNFYLPQDTCFHREDIAEAMGALGDSSAVPVLAEVYKTAWLELRAEIVRSLGKIGGLEVIDPLITALKDSHPKIRHIAVWKLYDYQHRRAKKALRQAFSRERNRDVRIDIESALSKWDQIR
jgi:HEAT repeat protein